MRKALIALVLVVRALCGTVPVQAQDTFVTVTDVVGGVYHLPLANCPTQGLTYTRSTNAFGCVSGATAPAAGSNTQVQFNDSGVLGGDAGFTYVKATDTATLGALVLTTALPATSGGTGLAVYAVGDLLYASTTTALSKLADVATGSVLVSGGVATAPAWSATPSLTSATLTGVTGNTLVVDTTTLVVDAANHRVGIGTASPSAPVQLVDAITDPAGTRTSLSGALTTTLTANNATVSRVAFLSTTVNQAGFNYTASEGIRGFEISAVASGSSGTVTGITGFRSGVGATGAGTVTTAIAFEAIGTNSGGGTVTTAVGFYQPSSSVGSTKYAFRGSLPASALNWNVFMDGTAQNFLAGNLGIGTGKSVPLTVLDVADVSTSAVRGIITGQYSASTDGGRLIGRKARGTAAAPTVITTGDTLASWVGEGYDGSNYLQTGAIFINSTGTIAATRVPTTILFQTGTDAAPSVLTTALTLGADQIGTFAKGMQVTPPTTQTIAAGNTVAADSCGGLKAITAAGAVSTDTTNTFTAPAAANTGCLMYVCNTGATNAITLDKNANFLTLAGADVVLLANSCIAVVSNGTLWKQLTALLTSS